MNIANVIAEKLDEDEISPSDIAEAGTSLVKALGEVGIRLLPIVSDVVESTNIVIDVILDAEENPTEKTLAALVTLNSMQVALDELWMQDATLVLEKVMDFMQDSGIEDDSDTWNDACDAISTSLIGELVDIQGGRYSREFVAVGKGDNVFFTKLPKGVDLNEVLDDTPTLEEVLFAKFNESENEEDYAAYRVAALNALGIAATEFDDFETDEVVLEHDEFDDVFASGPDGLRGATEAAFDALIGAIDDDESENASSGSDVTVNFQDDKTKFSEETLLAVDAALAEMDIDWNGFRRTPLRNEAPVTLDLDEGWTDVGVVLDDES